MKCNGNKFFEKACVVYIIIVIRKMYAWVMYTVYGRDKRGGILQKHYTYTSNVSTPYRKDDPIQK